jgi:hypothetical protein
VEDETCEASAHFINKCSCGAVISQCRCSGAKTVTTIDNGCDQCKAKIKDNLSETIKSISQTEKTPVNIERENMKIASLKDITDENLKQASAAEISTLIAEELRKASEVWEAEKKESSAQLSAAVKSAEDAHKEIESFKEQVKKNEAALAELVKEKEDRARVDAFNVRMAAVSEKFDLDDEAKAAIVEEIKVIDSEESFAAWMKKASILLKGFAKKMPFPPKKGEKGGKGEKGKEGCECEEEMEEEDAKKKCKATEEALAAEAA